MADDEEWAELAKQPLGATLACPRCGREPLQVIDTPVGDTQFVRHLEVVNTPIDDTQVDRHLMCTFCNAYHSVRVAARQGDR